VSHFTLLVVTAVEPTDSVLAEVLAPFVEEVGPGDQYAVWKDCTQEVDEGFASHATENARHKQYATLEEYGKGWHGYDQNAAGRWGYWHNPNAKWDGYQLGGRWSGGLEIKPKNATACYAKFVDAAQVKNLVTDLTTEPQFALLTANGKWHERGQMGWWGIASDEQTPEQWAAEYAEFVADIKPEQWVAVVDCHI
jgi:hypothetical protein